ncbi:MAG TPA: sigma-54 factor interaction domain-containing protein, partial [Thermoanaerobaculia bacterium]|nr:sigma-54 factor interaction domain-containing protein [Thermoanaerobaculia bacterium]
GALASLRDALGPLEARSETAIAERLAALASERIVVLAVAEGSAIDEASRRVLQLAAATRGANWLTAAAGTGGSEWFVVAPRLAAAEALRRRIGSASDPRAWVNDFLTSTAFADYLRNGTVPPGPAPALELREPNRSYLAALALLGRTIPRATADRFLRELLFERDPSALEIEGVFHAGTEHVAFASDAVREWLAALNPAASRPAICRVAARAAEEEGDVVRAGGLLMEAGDDEGAVLLFERAWWEDRRDLLAATRRIPPRALSVAPRLGRAIADALLAEGRYRDAREVAAALEEHDREIVLARAERRTGHYAPALLRLSRLPRSAEADLLRAELLIVERREQNALEILASCTPATEDERARRDYLHALLDSSRRVELRHRYLAARLKTYRALEAGDHDAALAFAEESLAAAGDVAGRIDSRLDRVYTLFEAGRWSDARAAAMEALADVEETQGDRAAGGLLFLLAWLSADDGQWSTASQYIDRLRDFYSGTRDERRLAEIDLLTAHLDFSRGRFDSARRIASALVERGCDRPIREAASVIRLESAWIDGEEPPPDPLPQNVELAERYALRRAGVVPSPSLREGGFNAALRSWEMGLLDEAPAARTGSEKLKLFRSALGRGRRRRDGRLLELAHRIASEMGIDLAAIDERPDREMLVLRAAARREFPFAPSDLEGIPWRFATRNRLGQWQQIGSEAAVGDAELDAVAAGPEGDWIACSDRELLWIERSAEWSAESRDALAAIFHARAELHRLRRLFEQEEASNERPVRRDDLGIVGNSPAMRDVLDLIARVSRREVAVCVRGESGTGKELVANALHRLSARRQKTFTAVNCAALPEQLIESELFGHVRGAFTGADRDRAGLIEATDGGTLFLDEIGEMPLAAQAKLLRFLQEGEFRRVGDAATRTADVR